MSIAVSTKSGKRHSQSDQAHLDQALHHLMSAGATLPESEAPETDTDDMGNTDAEAEGKSVDMDVLIANGSEIKALGEGRFGGYLVRYGTSSATDLEGDYFTPETDFDFTDGQRTSIYYDHGLDPVLKRRKVGEGSLKRDEVGVWLEFQLQRRDEYEQAIETLAKKGKLGLSSGTAPHLVERVREGKANRITAWPLGIDASVTPTPAEPRTMVLPLKSYRTVAIQPSTDETASATDSTGESTGDGDGRASTPAHSDSQRAQALMLHIELLDL